MLCFIINPFSMDFFQEMPFLKKVQQETNQATKLSPCRPANSGDSKGKVGFRRLDVLDAGFGVKNLAFLFLKKARKTHTIKFGNSFCNISFCFFCEVQLQRCQLNLCEQKSRNPACLQECGSFFP